MKNKKKTREGVKKYLLGGRGAVELAILALLPFLLIIDNYLLYDFHEKITNMPPFKESLLFEANFLIIFGCSLVGCIACCIGLKLRKEKPFVWFLFFLFWGGYTLMVFEIKYFGRHEIIDRVLHVASLTLLLYSGVLSARRLGTLLNTSSE